MTTGDDSLRPARDETTARPVRDDTTARPARDDATLRQIAAADPARSTWLGANAGSGKTRVLTDRVARLLLAGTPPQNVLCLTYTKAAASEMQNRLFARLGGWAMTGDDELRRALAELGVDGPLDATALDGARRLFAQAIETPGGLKIQTIHAFCAALLRQFPVEAGVSPGFTELDDRSGQALADAVLELLADGPGADALDGIAQYLSGDGALADLTRAILARRADFEAPMDLDACLAAHGLPPGYDDDALLADVFAGDEEALIAGIVPELAAGSKRDAEAADKLRLILGRVATMPGLRALEIVLLTQGGKAPFTPKIGTLPTKATQAKLGETIMDPLNDLMQRVADARQSRLALGSARRTAALHRFTAALLPAIAAQKTARGVLDFDDLILRARALLTERAGAGWVLYKLDGRMDHILVDEAQDTSPPQWDVIGHLAQELTAGAGARDGVNRTIFVVGDKKQSIYSFQGADPAGFDRLRDRFDAALATAGPGLQKTVLEYSFRSSPAILRAVDATFDGPELAAAVGDAAKHSAFKADLPGRVDLWPAIAPEADDDQDSPWSDPVDRLSPQAPAARLADAIAGELRRLIDAGETVPDGKGGRVPLHEGHVLILVRTRGAIYREIIRACKAARLDIAGADRLRLSRDLGVQDLMALLAFLALPEDDLSLAAALRSPLFGWSEDDLYRLAQPREGTLWAALRSEHAGTATHDILKDMLDGAEFRRPYDLLERILIRHRGRVRLIARLGAECEEAIDALLAEALAFEHGNIPSLTGFLEWMRDDSIDIKRQAEGAGRRLRVMTVHGAKGLEAPLVILPDCARPGNAPRAPVILTDATGHGIWTPPAGDTPDSLADLRSAAIARQRDEALRLLYVAMTRAETWLWVCAANGKRPDTALGWHERVAEGLARAGAAPFDTPVGPGLRLGHGDWHGPMAQPAAPETAASVSLPGWIAEPPPPETATRSTIAASALGGAKALPGDAGLDEDAAKARGTFLHLLLEHLPAWPEASWAAFAPDLLGMAEDPPDAETAADLIDEAIGVLTDPALRAIFGPGSLAEVPLACPLPGLLPAPHDRLTGVIDRLIVTPDRVHAIDYKSNATMPDRADTVPEGLLRQMGAYGVALETLYPGREVDLSLLWTRGPRLMPLPRDLVMAALRRAVTDPGAA
jgi:ATP-dependent helicase/nuclease subunit A